MIVDESRRMWFHVSMTDEKRPTGKVKDYETDEPAFTRQEIQKARGGGAK